MSSVKTQRILRGFHIPSTTDKIVAIRSQFLFSEALKFTPRRSLLPIISIFCCCFPPLPPKGRNNNDPCGDTKDCCSLNVRYSFAKEGQRSSGAATANDAAVRRCWWQRWCERDGGGVCNRERDRDGDSLLSSITHPPIQTASNIFTFLWVCQIDKCGILHYSDFLQSLGSYATRKWFSWDYMENY